MLRTLALAAAVATVAGAATLASYDDASAKRGGGFSRGGGSGGGFGRGGGMGRHGFRTGGPRAGRHFSPRRPAFGRGHRVHRRTHSGHYRTISRPHHARFGSRPVHWRHGSRPVHWRFGSRPVHWRYGSKPRHWRFGSRPTHWRFGSRPSHYRWGSGRVVYGAPATYAAPVRTAGPACYTCGGWTDDGCYMTYRKVVDENGNPQLKCVKACDEEPAPQAS